MIERLTKNICYAYTFVANNLICKQSLLVMISTNFMTAQYLPLFCCDDIHAILVNIVSTRFTEGQGEGREVLDDG
jgi:hypothetical protein